MDKQTALQTIASWTGDRLELQWSEADIVCLSADELHMLDTSLHNAINEGLRLGLFDRATIQANPVPFADWSYRVVLERSPLFIRRAPQQGPRS
jgi:hypothetical protein